MATREDFIKEDLFKTVKAILTRNACQEGFRNTPQAVRKNPSTLKDEIAERTLQEIAHRAIQDITPAVTLLLDTKHLTNLEIARGDSVEILGRKILVLAKKFLQDQKLVLARDLVYQVALRLVGRSAYIPGSSDSGTFNPIYETLGIHREIILLACFHMLARFSYLNCNWFQSLSWVEEFQTLRINIEIPDKARAKQAWENHDDMLNPMYVTQVIEGLSTICNLSQAFQNTGLYHYSMMIADRYIRILPQIPVKGPIPNKANLLKERKREFEALLHIRHPDPQTCFKYVLIDPRFQVSGVWKRLPVKPNESMRRRSLSSSFIWKGYLYIAGGVTRSDHQGRVFSDSQDIWRLQLEPPCEWQLFSKLPPSSSVHNRSRFPGVNFKVYEDKGYLFTGDPTLDILDLKTGKWSKLETTYLPTAADRMAGIDTEWPWGCSGSNYVTGAALQIIEDRLLVFSGIHVNSLLGCNLLMELNLKTMQWRRLSGYTRVQQEINPKIPGPRYNAASWAENGKLFILYGVCERIKPHLGLENNIGPSEQWVWNDMWSWDTKREKWRRERIAGNPPAPRYEMGHVYNEKLKQVIIFGGVNPTCRHEVTRTNEFLASETTYADTFLLSTSGKPGVQVPLSRVVDATSGMSDRQPGPYSWKQVMTCGFPTYRAGPALACDPDTGKIYMYGGRVRGDFVPNKNHTEIQAAKRGKEALRKSRPSVTEVIDSVTPVPYRYFGHVWQLHLDIPGGHFECINKEDEMRTAPPGPWNRCFECGKADFWKKCGGTCGGRAHFCTEDCQAKGWELHKQMHGCTKP